MNPVLEGLGVLADLLADLRGEGLVLAQGEAIDVLVVDDNSPDGTARLVESMAGAERTGQLNIEFNPLLMQA